MKLGYLTLFAAGILAITYSDRSVAREVTITDLASAQAAGFYCRNNVQQDGGSQFGLTCWQTGDIPASDTVNLSAPMTFFFGSPSSSSTPVVSSVAGVINVSGGASIQIGGAEVTIATGGSINLINGDKALVIYGDQGTVAFNVAGTLNVSAKAAVLSRLQGNGANYTVGWIPPFLNVQSSGTLINNGKIGTDLSWGGFPAPSIINNSGTITNSSSGTITVFPGSEFNNNAGAVLTNNGTIQNGYGTPSSQTTVGTAELKNLGTLINNGTIDNGKPGSNFAASITNGTSGIIAGTGTITGSGTKQNVSVIRPPGAPTITNPTAQNARVSLTWTAPGDDGGGKIDRYTVLVEPGNQTQECTSQPCYVNLSNGTAYTLKLAAHNVAGRGAYSAGVTKTPPFNSSVTFGPSTYSYAPDTTHATNRTWNVPEGISQIRVTAIGAGGGAGNELDGHNGGPGGSGAKIQTPVLPVDAGQLVTMNIGAVGSSSAGGDCTSVNFSSGGSAVAIIAGGGGGGGRAGNTGDGAAGGNGGQGGQLPGGAGLRASNLNDTNSTGRVGYPGLGGNGGTGGSAGDYWTCVYQGSCTQQQNTGATGQGGSALQCYSGGDSAYSGGAGGGGYGGGGAAGKSSSRGGYSPGDSGGGAGGSAGPQGSGVSVANNGGNDGSVIIEY
ncbi:MAG: fibronectin type III domain-containing protein [Burkholderiales bacterium]|nr:fibronectin type III domain-containing protein [Burkholderiales bacterium]